jgi:hypothetical protein
MGGASLAVAALCHTPAFGLDQSRPLSKPPAARCWRSEQGLPQNSMPMRILQSRDEFTCGSARRRASPASTAITVRRVRQANTPAIRTTHPGPASGRGTAAMDRATAKVEDGPGGWRCAYSTRDGLPDDRVLAACTRTGNPAGVVGGDPGRRRSGGTQRAGSPCSAPATGCCKPQWGLRTTERAGGLWSAHRGGGLKRSGRGASPPAAGRPARGVGPRVAAARPRRRALGWDGVRRAWRARGGGTRPPPSAPAGTAWPAAWSGPSSRTRAGSLWFRTGRTEGEPPGRQGGQAPRGGRTRPRLQRGAARRTARAASGSARTGAG